MEANHRGGDIKPQRSCSPSDLRGHPHTDDRPRQWYYANVVHLEGLAAVERRESVDEGNGRRQIREPLRVPSHQATASFYCLRCIACCQARCKHDDFDNEM